MGLQAFISEKFLQHTINRDTVPWILRCKRGTSDQITCPALLSILRDPAPEQVQDLNRAMIGVNAGAADLHQTVSQRFVWCQVELAIAVIPEIVFGYPPGLQPVGTDYAATLHVFDHQVVADGVEFVNVIARLISGFESFIEFKIEDFKTKAKTGRQVNFVTCQANTVSGLRKAINGRLPGKSRTINRAFQNHLCPPQVPKWGPVNKRSL